MNRIGVALVIVGIAVFVAGGIGYDRQKTVLEVGGLKATSTEHKTIPYWPVLGAISLIGGIVLLAGARRQAT
jgi:hypothetical protein